MLQTKKAAETKMACFERASPMLKEILLKIHRAERPMEIDHTMHEFGSVHYHVQHSASDPLSTYLSISTPLLSQGSQLSELPHHDLAMVKGNYPDIMDIIEPPKVGYQLTLKLNLARIPHNKETKIIADIASVQAVILSSQLKEVLRNIDSHETCQGMCKPIKLVYHPREPFFVIKQPLKITAVFPMRFKEDTDVIIATAFFQELMDVGSKGAFAKAPHCIWSPIPPPELRGEPIEDLSTNGGFVSFDITSGHVEGKKLDKTVWSLLNFYALVKYHVKCTRGFMQRRMRVRLESLVQLLQHSEHEEEENQLVRRKFQGCKRVKKWVNVSKSKIIKRKYGFASKIRRIRSRLRIHCFSHFRRRWLTITKFSKVTRYRKLV